MRGWSRRDHRVSVLSVTDDEQGRVSGKPVAIAIAAVLIVAALVKWWPSDVRAVRRQFDALADVLSVPPVESDVSRMARLADLQSYFADAVQIRLTEQHIPNRDALMALAESWTPPPGGVFVEFVDENISIPGDNTAHVTLTAKISRKNQSTGETDVEERPAEFDLAKRHGDWVITAAESPASQPAR